MKLYTQILIAMLIGIVLGLGFGPQSPFFNKDLYKLNSTASAIFYPSLNTSTPLSIFSTTPLSLEILEHDGKEGDPLKASWAKVSLEVGTALLLSSKNQALKDYLKTKYQDFKAGQSVELWLKIPYQKLSSGEQIPLYLPSSSQGTALMSFLQPFGDLFMRLLKMVIMPLVFASLIVGVASLGDVRKLGKIGGKTLGIYMVTTAIAVAIGLLCTHLLSPGSYLDEASKLRLLSQFEAQALSKTDAAASSPSVIDGILQIVPTNLASAFVKEDMLAIIFFALFLGIALSMLKEKGQTLIKAMDDLQEAMIVMIQAIMKVAPIGVAALVAHVVGQSGFSVLKALLVYGMTVLIGLLIHCSFIYGGLLKLSTKTSVWHFIKAIRPAQLVAFSTSSSSATLPVTIECAEKHLSIKPQIASFVLPLGSTVNMDGTALYQGVAAMFIAQVFNIDLSIGDQLSIVLTATLASVGAAGVPGAGMVTLTMVLSSVGIPVEGLALILGIDRLLDMFRTTVNITGDLVVAKMMDEEQGS